MASLGAVSRRVSTPVRNVEFKGGGDDAVAAGQVSRHEPTRR